MRSRRLEILVVTASLCAGCSDLAAPFAQFQDIGVLQLVEYPGPSTVGADESVRWSLTPEPGVLAPPRLIGAPDTVAANVAFDVTVTTIGVSGCWRAAGQLIHYDTRVIELTPLDAHSGARACTSMVQFLDRVFRVRLDSAGAWTLRVKGRRLPYLDDAWEQQVTAEKTIVAR
jgi:hypothetical protein